MIPTPVIRHHFDQSLTAYFPDGAHGSRLTVCGNRLDRLAPRCGQYDWADDHGAVWVCAEVAPEAERLVRDLWPCVEVRAARRSPRSLLPRIDFGRAGTVRLLTPDDPPFVRMLADALPPRTFGQGLGEPSLPLGWRIDPEQAGVAVRTLLRRWPLVVFATTVAADSAAVRELAVAR